MPHITKLLIGMITLIKQVRTIYDPTAEYQSTLKSLYLPVKIGKSAGRLSLLQSAFLNARINAVATNWTTHILVVVLVSSSVVVWCASNLDTILMNAFKNILISVIEIEILYFIEFAVV